ncbi:hypothetical protein QAD02_020862 [Eretmocerus hayati]|uniref:Uncharacterized protein n=1 Tax=Eretmocerus hayati TaxID=131215 RepID=A0ACC2PR41_9HYME|nr:hypothetical protein QAD02_020862 [Eretmocerus hayati]
MEEYHFESPDLSPISSAKGEDPQSCRISPTGLTPLTFCSPIHMDSLIPRIIAFFQVTKNKTWKDIAGLLGIGASSSAAYTLRKHYTKHLLAFECHFDRGGIDPQPIINQIEASSKKKIPKGATPVPSPGMSNFVDLNCTQ